jgi:hypothetical protein
MKTSKVAKRYTDGSETLYELIITAAIMGNWSQAKDIIAAGRKCEDWSGYVMADHLFDVGNGDGNSIRRVSMAKSILNHLL